MASTGAGGEGGRGGERRACRELWGGRGDAVEVRATNVTPGGRPEKARKPYGLAVGQFLAWCKARGLRLSNVFRLHVATYIRTHPGSVPTVKQYLAASRVLGDWLVVSQVIPANPAAAVRGGPKHVVTKGGTQVLTPAEARKLLEHIDTGTLVGLRDRAPFSVMLYRFARVSAVLGM